MCESPQHLQKREKSLTLIASRAASSKGKKKEERREQSVRDLVDFADERCEQAMELLDQAHARMPELDIDTQSTVIHERSRVCWFLSGLAMVADVARRRMVEGEDVPLSDRLFSVFEAHTELINRGKSPCPIELGHRCLIIEDNMGYILHAHVMANGRQDRDVAATITRLLTRDFPSLKSISFDRGFHSPSNQERLPELIETPCLPTTGVQAATEQSEAASQAWHEARRRHPGIESAIGALQSGNGCRRCRDRSKLGYRRYLALAVLGRNLLTLGRHMIAKDYPRAVAGKSQRQLYAA